MPAIPWLAIFTKNLEEMFNLIGAPTEQNWMAQHIKMHALEAVFDAA
jgi:hypothetical protein